MNKILIPQWLRDELMAAAREVEYFSDNDHERREFHKLAQSAKNNAAGLIVLRLNATLLHSQIEFGESSGGGAARMRVVQRLQRCLNDLERLQEGLPVKRREGAPYADAEAGATRDRHITLPDPQWQHAQAQEGGASAYIRRLIDADRGR